MSHTIEHFMWGYQSHYRIKQKLYAKDIFQSLEKRFDPEIFLVGILVDDIKDRRVSCVEPENEFWITSDYFKDVLKRSRITKEAYPENRMLHSHALAQQWHDESLSLRSIKDTITSIISEYPNKPFDMQYYVSLPTNLDGYMISIILGLQSSILLSYTKLLVDNLNIEGSPNYRASTSLIEATIIEYFECARRELYKPYPGAGFDRDKSPNEILRSAGARLMTDISIRVDADIANRTLHWGMVYDTINRISSLTYEKANCIGKLLVAAKSHAMVTRTISFTNPIELYNVRASRKLLELANKECALHTNTDSIYGLVELKNILSDNEDLFIVDIISHYMWELCYNGRVLMRVQYGIPSLPAPIYDENILKKDVRRIFKTIKEDNIEHLNSLVKGATNEKHGTLVIISENADTESDRLGQQGIRIIPCPLKQSLLKNITPIDGAIMLGPTGICYAIGVILDGMATDKGDSSRGARYNSAIRYIEMQKNKCKCMAIIISEDGMIDIIPKMRPAIERARIDDLVWQLKEMGKNEDVGRIPFNMLMGRIEELKFYLLKKHCAIINRVSKSIDARITKREPSSIRIVWPRFTPDPDFSEDLYYE